MSGKVAFTRLVYFAIFYTCSISLFSCGPGIDRGSCNVMCNVTTGYAASRDWCVDKAASVPHCRTIWSNDGEHWELLWPLADTGTNPPPVNTGPDTTPPAQRILTTKLTAANQITADFQATSKYESGLKFEVTRNNVIITPQPSSYAVLLDTDVSELTEYCYSVVAIDLAGNRSTKSPDSCITTPVSPLKWSRNYSALGPDSSTAIIGSDHTIYGFSTNGDNSFNAINPDGTLKWSYPTSSAYITDTPIIANEQLYFVRGQTVYCLNLDGSLSWTYLIATSDGAIEFIEINTDTVFISTNRTASKVIAIDLNGSYKWTYTDAAGGRIILETVNSTGTPYLQVALPVSSFPIRPVKLQALNPDGSLKWEHISTVAEYDTSEFKALGNDDTAYIEVAGYNGPDEEYSYSLQAIQSDGSLIWEYPLTSKIKTSIVKVSDDTIYFSTYFRTSLSANAPFTSELIALNLDGSLKWKYSDQDYLIFSGNILLGSDGTIYVSNDYRIYALNSDGSLKWFSNENSDEYVYLKNISLINDNTLFYFNYGQVGVETLDGSKKWLYAIDDANIFKPVIIANELLIFGGGKIYAFDVSVN